jgi:hypothetical protein
MGGLNRVGALPDGTTLAPPTVRRLACDAALIEVSVDAHGQPLSVGRKTRAIPAAIKRALAVRDRTCRFPSCTNHRFLDGHHVHHWADGGETSLANLVSLCSHHHRCVHEEGYQIIMDDRGQPSFLDASGSLIVEVPDRPAPADVGWQSIRAANEPLALDAMTGTCKWAGERVNYGYAVDVILGAVRQARRQAAQEPR